MISAKVIIKQGKKVKLQGVLVGDGTVQDLFNIERAINTIHPELRCHITTLPETAYLTMLDKIEDLIGD